MPWLSGLIWGLLLLWRQGLLRVPHILRWLLVEWIVGLLLSLGWYPLSLGLDGTLTTTNCQRWLHYRIRWWHCLLTTTLSDMHGFRPVLRGRILGD